MGKETHMELNRMGRAYCLLKGEPKLEGRAFPSSPSVRNPHTKRPNCLLFSMNLPITESIASIVWGITSKFERVGIYKYQITNNED